MSKNEGRVTMTCQELILRRPNGTKPPVDTPLPRISQNQDSTDFQVTVCDDAGVVIESNGREIQIPW